MQNVKCRSLLGGNDRSNDGSNDGDMPQYDSRKSESAAIVAIADVPLHDPSWSRKTRMLDEKLFTNEEFTHLHKNP